MLRNKLNRLRIPILDYYVMGDPVSGVRYAAIYRFKHEIKPQLEIIACNSCWDIDLLSILYLHILKSVGLILVGSSIFVYSTSLFSASYSYCSNNMDIKLSQPWPNAIHWQGTRTNVLRPVMCKTPADFLSSGRLVASRCIIRDHEVAISRVLLDWWWIRVLGRLIYLCVSLRVNSMICAPSGSLSVISKWALPTHYLCVRFHGYL